MTLAVPGAHNVLNACAAYLCATEGVGAHPDGVVAGLARFAGARRRFEVIGEAGGITVVDDYAHNAGKVEAVVATATKIAHDRGGRLIAIFQPHLYSRTRDFAEGFAAGLAPADEIALLDIYGAREEPIPGVDSRLIADRLAGRADVMSPDAAVEWAASIAKPGDVVLTIGAGDITVIAPHILERLGSRR
jgi:UDP-N-acetylmuramate--alanine ligase